MRQTRRRGALLVEDQRKDADDDRLLLRDDLELSR
jgi:hypothetical protein